MKEAYPSKMVDRDSIQSTTESQEEMSDAVREGQERVLLNEKELDTSPISPTRLARTHAPDSIPMKEKNTEDTGGVTGISISEGGPSGGHVTQADLEKIWALDNAPPPIKVQRDDEDSDNSSHELSPPPSPKRKKNLLENDNVLKRPFSPIVPQDSI